LSEKATYVYSEKYFGVSIENGSRQGFKYIDSLGKEYFYLCKTTSITNDTIVPINLKIYFSKEYNHIRSNEGLKSKVFLLPKELTLDEQQFNVTVTKELKFDLGMTKELKRFLNTSIETVTLNKTLNPKEKCVVVFGILTDIKYKVPMYFGLKLKVNDFQYNKQDSIIKTITRKPSILPLVLYLDNPFAIPCGQISFPDN